ncbi:hypothetical protein FBU59_007095 [Linderina macrospora]|uniref:Uncharacterized protein n=1 Tax=Linderina macrospora TaxID=4868 RepID=A0ACC1IY31_9FUNG|nr:hypothetical protein FBU59_007095 [Linderina macrospora]
MHISFISIPLVGFALAKNQFCARNGDGNYVFQGSCSRFYSCANGFGWLQDCPGDLLFDTDLMECAWHDKVDCGDRPVEARGSSD